MTNERAVEILNLDLDILGQYGDETAEAYKMAIKALEQQPSEDCISRKAVLEHICEDKECYKEECKGRTLKRCYDLQWVFDLPSVTPERPKGQ